MISYSPTIVLLQLIVKEQMMMIMEMMTIYDNNDNGDKIK